MLAALSSLWKKKKEKITSLETRQHCAIEGLQQCKETSTVYEHRRNWIFMRTKQATLWPVHVCVGKGGGRQLEGEKRERNASTEYGHQKPKEKRVTWTSRHTDDGSPWDCQSWSFPQILKVKLHFPCDKFKLREHGRLNPTGIHPGESHLATYLLRL